VRKLGKSEYLAACLVAGILGLTAACGTMTTAIRPTPLPNATAVLKSDGYTPSLSLENSLSLSSLSFHNTFAAEHVTSSAAGINGGKDQVVIIYASPSWTSEVTKAMQSPENAFVIPGIEIRSSGDVMTVTGSSGPGLNLEIATITIIGA
jgi:hypothetical protein